MKKQVKKTKLSIIIEDVVDAYVENSYNISKGAQKLKIDRNTFSKHLKSAEAKQYYRDRKKARLERMLKGAESNIFKSLAKKTVDPEVALKWIADYAGFSGPARMAEAQLKQNAPEQAQPQTQGATEEEIQRFRDELKKRRGKK